MKFMKQTVYMVGTLVAVAMIATLVAPKSVHALVATLVRDVDNPARATIVSAVCLTARLGGGGTNCELYTVPSGQRLVIEQIEAICTTPTGTSVYTGALNFSAGGNYSSHWFALPSQGPTDIGGQRFVANQPVRYYVDPGSFVSFGEFSNDPTGNEDCEARVNGYLVSYP